MLLLVRLVVQVQIQDSIVLHHFHLHGQLAEVVVAEAALHLLWVPMVVLAVAVEVSLVVFHVLEAMVMLVVTVHLKEIMAAHLTVVHLNMAEVEVVELVPLVVLVHLQREVQEDQDYQYQLLEHQ